VGEGQPGEVLPEPALVAAEAHETAKRSPARSALLALGLAAVAVVLWAGYGHRWSWTGINGHTATLWDWLHLLLLPLAFALLPILLNERAEVRREHKLAGSVALLGLVIFVVAGYDVPWSWTGFSGNSLWDWLELLALPLAVALVPLTDDIRRSWGRRHSLAAAAALAAFVVALIGGYAGHWAWTGFHGNTLWDWLHLLLLPLLLPTLIVPRLKPRMEAVMIPAGAEVSTSAEAEPSTPAEAEPSTPAEAEPSTPAEAEE
jgi:hypothetical protein